MSSARPQLSCNILNTLLKRSNVHQAGTPLFCYSGFGAVPIPQRLTCTLPNLQVVSSKPALSKSVTSTKKREKSHTHTHTHTHMGPKDSIREGECNILDTLLKRSNVHQAGTPHFLLHITPAKKSERNPASNHALSQGTSLTSP